MTLETLITLLTIENNNMNNYIVTFEYRVMVTAFAILAMFFKGELPLLALLKNCCKKEEKKKALLLPGNDLLLLAARNSVLPPPGIHLHNKERV